MLRILTMVFVAFASTGNAAGVNVRDADTIVVDGTPVRLNGIDAPELSTRAGQDGRRWMV